MKLNWLRAGCASIAERGEYTANTWDDGSGYSAAIYAHKKVHVGFSEPTRDAVELACESWLDQRYKPQWKQAEEWLWSTTWRGACCAIRIGIDDRWAGMVVCGGWGKHSGSHADLDVAKAECETIMRERTDGAK